MCNQTTTVISKQDNGLYKVMIIDDNSQKVIDKKKGLNYEQATKYSYRYRSNTACVGGSGNGDGNGRRRKLKKVMVPDNK